jgi:uncharacterized UPF0146 family protein
MIKKEIVNGIEYTYSSDWIKKLEDEYHWRLYWQQQNTIYNFLNKGDTILEIGVGSGFTANYLKSKGFDVTTFDIDKEKKPDIIGNIVNYDWNKLTFNHLLAFEVFEHIPFDEFEKALSKLKKVITKNIFISLPINERVLFECKCKFPKLGKRSIRITKNKNKITERNHFWEINYDKYSENFVEEMFGKKGYKVIKKEKKDSFIFYVLGYDE